MPTWTIEQLRGSHDRGAFTCGKATLDDFLQKYATQYQRRDLARTYVAFLPPDLKVRGYYTLSAGAVDLSVLPDEKRKKLPRHPVPVALLGRLAVDLTARGQRLGETLLLDALRRCGSLADDLGLFAVEVHAIDDEAVRFYLKYGFLALLDEPGHLYLPIKTVRTLNL